jgi:DNA-binding LacI/PurR family transcriptional regulator
LAEQDAFDRLTALVRSGEAAFDSIFASTHALTMGLAKALRRTGHPVAAISGFDEFLGRSLLPWPTSAVRQPIERIARTALELLDSRTVDDQPRRVVLEAMLSPAQDADNDTPDGRKENEC